MLTSQILEMNVASEPKRLPTPAAVKRIKDSRRQRIELTFTLERKRRPPSTDARPISAATHWTVADITRVRDSLTGGKGRPSDELISEVGMRLVQIFRSTTATCRVEYLHRLEDISP